MLNVTGLQKFCSVLSIALLVSACSLTMNTPSQSGSGGQTIDYSNPICAQIETVPQDRYCEYAAKISNPKLSGAGTVTNPYIICSPYQLNAIGTDPTLLSASIQLAASVDMSCISGNHTMIGSSTQTFTGSFDGGGNKIKNWTYVDANLNYVGLFSYTEGGSIANFTMENAVVTGKDWTAIVVGDSEGGHLLKLKTSGTVTGGLNVGSIAGRAEVGAVEQSSSSATVNGAGSVGGLVGSGGTPLVLSSYFTGTVNATGDIAGGIIGYNIFGDVKNSYFTGTVISTANWVGGIAGAINSGTITNDYSAGSVTGLAEVGGLIGGFNGAGAASNSFSTASVSGNGTTTTVGYLVGTALGTITNGHYWASAACDSSTAPGLQACNTNTATSHALVSYFYNLTNAPLSSWDFLGESVNGIADQWIQETNALPVAFYIDPTSVALPFTIGNGSTEYPYEVNSVALWNAIGTNPRLMGAHFKLTSNIDFSAQTYVQIGRSDMPFYGTLDGNSKSLQNVTFGSGAILYSGLFGNVMNPSYIHDVSITSAAITGSAFSGILVGASTGLMKHVTIGGTITGGWHSGGAIGILTKPGLISDSTVAANVTASGSSSAIGGLVGNLTNGTVQRCSSSGTLTGGGNNKYGGGLVGMLNGGNVSDSYTTVNITGGVFDWAGGVAGRVAQPSAITSSYATGNVFAKQYVGAAVGQIVDAGSSVTNVFATGNITGTGGAANVGAFAGASIGTITNGYALATATCDSQAAGGIQACNATGVAGSAAALSNFYSPLQAPMTTWDFSTVWLNNVTLLPTLR
jgi:fibronectin-binding autotransporter adhesin